MVNYDIEEGCIITGIGMSGEERTGVCTNVMDKLRMASVKYGNDRLDFDIIEFSNIKNIKGDTNEKD